jgi:saccharopine dehydrogenase-like NADP-dependent oxidoreductase
VENGQIVTKPALSETELIDYKEVGTLQAFNTDGLRTLLRLPIPQMKEKTLRYPGHITYIKALKSIGFFNEEEIEVNGQKIRPIDVTSKILLPQWKLNPEDEEYTIMDVIVKYRDKGVLKEDTYHLYDAYDPATKTHSMSRTTGYTCAAVCETILNHLFEEKGVFAGEHIGMKKDLFDNILTYLAARNINFEIEKKIL